MTTILCVDDEPGNRALLARLLTRSGYRVIQAAHVRGAIDSIHREPALALILLDLNLPEVDGFDALRMIKADPRTREIPVVVVSSTAKASAEEEVQQLGANEFVGNPVTDDRILGAVRRAIGPQSAPAT